MKNKSLFGLSLVCSDSKKSVESKSRDRHPMFSTILLLAQVVDQAS